MEITEVVYRLTVVGKLKWTGEVVSRAHKIEALEGVFHHEREEIQDWIDEHCTDFKEVYGWSCTRYITSSRLTRIQDMPIEVKAMLAQKGVE